MSPRDVTESLKQILSDLPNSYLGKREVDRIVNNFQTNHDPEQNPLMYLADFLTYLEDEATNILAADREYIWDQAQALVEPPRPKKEPDLKARLREDLKKILD